MVEECLQSRLLPATPMAFPRATGVEDPEPWGMKGYDVWCWRRFWQNNCISIIHVFRPFREKLPQKTPGTTSSLLCRVKLGLVNCLEKGVPEWQVVARVPWRYPKFSKHNRHPEMFLSIFYVSVHPRLRELQMGIRYWLWNPISTIIVLLDQKLS